MHEYLKNKGYRAIINASLLSGIGDSLYNIVFIIYASSVPNKKLAVSLASVATLIPGLLAVVTGALADKTKHKVYSSIIVRFIQCALFILLAVLIGVQSSFPIFLVLLLINIISDTLGSFGNGLGMPLLQKLLPAEELNSGLGLMSAAGTTVQIIFQAVGASMIVALSYNYPVFGLVNAVTFMVAGLILLWNRQHLLVAEKKMTINNSSEHDHRSMWDQIKTAVRNFRQNNFLLRFTCLAMMVNFLGVSMSGMINLSLLTYKEIWLGNYGYSIVLYDMSFSIGIILGSLFMNDFLKKAKTFTITTLCMLALVGVGLGFAWHKSIVIIVAFILLASYLIGKINPRVSALVMTSVDDDQIAATSGVLNLLALCVAPLGQALFLTIAGKTSPVYSWILFTGLSLIVAMISSYWGHKVVEPEIKNQEEVAI